MDLKMALFLFPLIYVLIPFILTGSFIILGGVTLIAFIVGMLIFIVVTNLNIRGDAQALASGGGLGIGLNDTGGNSLFIVFFGGLFYLGASLAQIIAPILTIFTSIINAIIGFLGWITGIDVSAMQTSTITSLGGTGLSNLNTIYNLDIKIQGISVFLTLDILFASLFILALYFMVSSRN
jgi:hypothetical protein